MDNDPFAALLAHVGGTFRTERGTLFELEQYASTGSVAAVVRPRSTGRSRPI